MRFTFTVHVELTRSEGKFATREELHDQLVEALENANPGELQGDNDGQYVVESWEVSEEEPERVVGIKAGDGREGGA
jgi:hypothetical protein